MSSISRRGFVGLAGALGVSTVLGCSVLEHGPERSGYDVIVVGAGVVGCCARELARYDLNVLVVEAGLDIASGATRANSGIVHVGFDPKPGTLKARYNVAGAAAYPRWQKELGFTYIQNGALVLAFNDEERAVLDTLVDQAAQNGTEEVEILDAAELRALEPEAPVEAVAALHAPTSATVDPYGVAFAAAENAADNGVEFIFGRQVTAASRVSNGFELTIDAARGKLAAAADAADLDASVAQDVSCRCILNAAGIHADAINNMLSSHKLKIQPKRGEYLLYQAHSPFTRTMFQAPTAAGKGVLVGQTVFGNAFIGPNSVPQKSRSDVSTTTDGVAEILEKAQKTWPAASEKGVISTFAGLRASNADNGDFVIGQAKDVSGLFNAACIDSPGLASAPAIAEDLASGIADYLKASPRDNFNPVRQTRPLYNFADDETKARLLSEDPAYGIEVCSCYGVAQAEVVSALHGKLPVYSLDAIKWRTGAMMGQCQGGRCTARIARLVADELDIEVPDIEKRLAKSWLGVKKLAPAAGQGIDASFDEAVYELPRAGYLICGTRPAGVYSARAVLELLANDGVLPGQNVVIWGKTELAQRVADALGVLGVTVKRLEDSEKVIEVLGEARVEGVKIEDGGDVREQRCDALVISMDLVAST